MLPVKFGRGPSPFVVLVTVMLVSLWNRDASAQLTTLNSSVRALGMGDAWTALSDDSSALFYNPAGLARVGGVNVKIFSLRAGASGFESLKKIQNLNADDEDEYAEALQELYGEHVWSGAGASTAFTLPMLGFAIYNHADALIKIDNPVYPEIYTSVINDYGYVLGLGLPIAPVFHLGMNLKYIKRTGARVPYGASFIADLDSDQIYNNITGWGKGYGADLGMNLVIPAPLFSATVSAVWRNVGEISFRSNDPNANIPRELNDMTVAAALNFDTPLLSIAPAVDIRHLNREDIQLTRKLNFGIEIGLPLIDIRGGFREGYFTGGLGVNLGLFQVDAATYGVELGDYPGQIEDRRYVLEFTMELGIGNFTAPSFSGGKSVAGAASSSPAASRSNSYWGGRRLKQRR